MSARAFAALDAVAIVFDAARARAAISATRLELASTSATVIAFAAKGVASSAPAYTMFRTVKRSPLQGRRSRRAASNSAPTTHPL